MRIVSSKRSGFTLIEVIIAMAIFLVGAVAIVRIFPPALAAVQGSQDRSNAARLASSQIARFRLRTNNPSVPDAIYNGAGDGTYDNSFGGAFNGTVRRNDSLPSDLRSISQNSALDKGRYIDGERQRVMKSNDGTTPDKYFVLTNFPYADGSVKLSIEDKIEGVQVRYDGANYHFNFSSATYASDGSSASHASNSAYPKYATTDYRYYISYRWMNGGRINGVVDEPYVITYDPVSSNPLKPVRDQTFSLLEENVDVRVIYTVPAVSITEQSQANDDLRGVYVFSGGGLNAGDIVRVSYQLPEPDAIGWRGLVIDQAPANGAITMSTRGLDTDSYGDTVYALAYAAPDAEGKSNGILRRGECREPDTAGTCKGSSGAIETVTTSASQTNRITFDRNNPTGLSGLTAPRARVVYRPQDGWGVQVAVAARSYMPFVNFTLPGGTGYKTEPWREYSWQSGSPDLYFQPSEAGKTIAVSYEYQNGSAYPPVKDAIVTLSERTIDAPSSGFTGSGGKVAIATLTDSNGDPIANVTAVLGVRGVSVQARTVWADNKGRYSQTVVSDYRKRT